MDMIRKYLLPVLAAAGVAYAIYVAIQGGRTLPPARPVSEAPQPPYQTFIAGSGIVEANTENIAIGTHVAGIVSDLYVAVGSQVNAGDALFTIDNRAQSALVTIKGAAVKVAETQLDHAVYQEKLGVGLSEKRVLSIEDRDTRRQAVQTAEAQLAQAKADLTAAMIDLDRLTVRAPVSGQVMQLKLHRGEFAPTGVLPQPLMLLGNVTPMNVRVDVDENDAWRVHPGASATAYLRGNKDINVPLTFVRFEPYVIPKTSLSGESTERVDTRVLQVIFSFDRGELPISVGQQMDVFIDGTGPKFPRKSAGS
jgi:RND family efflux transporter MFP subunit